MKNTSIFKLLSVVLILLVSNSYITAQCANQITHETGTAEVNGIQVTITTSGTVSNTPFCSDAQPYWAGGSENGSFTFHFFPAIDSLTFNVSSIHKSGTYEEVVKLRVNGEHYSIPAVSDLNSCSEYLAILTSEGTLGADSNTERHGVNNISIVGPINSFTVVDSAVVGDAGGCLFGVAICSESVVSSAVEYNPSELQVYPNPALDKIFIEGLPENIEEVSLYDQLGRKINSVASFPGSESIIDVSIMPAGVYYIMVYAGDQTVSKKIIIGGQ